jgi:bifunctional UDP-N-acetylglucosamine pyrophosphorylase/glucosamine-1-phosphate N-acetyltransferase
MLIERVEAGVPLAFLSCELDDPTGYGRILRESGKVIAIREHKDLSSDSQRAVREVNAGVYAAEVAGLQAALAALTPDNAQAEYYLTDVVETLAANGRVEALVGHRDALLGVNDRRQLAEAETLLYHAIAERHRQAGVTVRTPAYIDDAVELEPDCIVEAGVSLRGATRIARGARIDVGSVVTNCSVGADTYLKPYSVMTDSRVGAGAQIGPFAHLRPDSTIEDEAHIGNFVETKKTRVRRGAKANHLAYLGDGDVGEGANLGAGTIFCNYDGYQNHRTDIGPGVFVGSDSLLVAPVRIGAGAFVASGTTVTQDVPDDGMALSRVKQVTKEGYASKLKSRLAAAAGKKP